MAKYIKIFVIGVLFLLFCSSSIAYGQGGRVYTYWFSTADIIPVGWDAHENYQMGDTFDVKVKWVETGHEYNIGSTPELQINITAPRVGHFDVYVRASRSGTDENGDPVTLKSEWIVSTDPNVALVDGSPEGWRVYWYMAAPGPVIISTAKYNLKNEEKQDGKNQRTNYCMGRVFCTRFSRLQNILEENRKFRGHC